MKNAAKPGEGGVYAQGGMLRIWWYTTERDPKTGRLKRDWLATGLRVGQEKTAKAALERIRLQMQEEERTGQPAGPMTLARFAEGWFRERERDGVETVGDERGRFKHAKELHDFLLEELTPGHFQALIKTLAARIGPRKEDMASRTVLHVHSGLRQMLGAAVARQLIPANPCVVEKKDLPNKRDKIPGWRKKAVFTRSEAEQLLSDPRVPEERRFLYCLLFCAGLRVGEAAALRWHSYDPEREPLGGLSVSVSFSRKKNKEKGTKTDQPRDVPVHPTLAKAIATWKLGGFERYMGQRPKPDDLLIPAATGNNLRDPVVHANLHRDLAALGLRPRRVHDTRRTMISLTRGGGAHTDKLKWITHGPSAAILDVYTEYPWEDLCAEIAKLKLESKEGRLVQLRQVAGTICDAVCDDESSEMKKPPTFIRLEAQNGLPRAGFEPELRGRADSVRIGKPPQLLGRSGGEPNPSTLADADTVTASQPDIQAQLADAVDAWDQLHDPADLRRRLSSLLASLPGGDS